MAYPTGFELQAFLVTANIIEANSNVALDYQGYVDAAIAKWESDTGRFPFLATESTTRKFNAPDGSILVIGSGITDETTPVVTLDGRTLVAGVDYDMAPLNAPSVGRPYQYVNFRYPLSSQISNPANITVTGWFGWSTSLPSDVQKAILSIAAATILTSASGNSGAVTQIKQDDVSISYAGIGSDNSHKNANQLQFEDYYNETVKRYRMTKVF